MDPVRVSPVEPDTIRPDPTTEGTVLVTVRLAPVPAQLWRARFNQSLLRSSNFGRFELGSDGASVNVMVRSDEQVGDRLIELGGIVEQTNTDAAEEERRLDAEDARQQLRQDADVERVRRDVEALDA
jgi:hypothetical protein